MSQGIFSARFVLLNFLEHLKFLRQLSIMSFVLLQVLHLRSEFHYTSLATFPTFSLSSCRLVPECILTQAIVNQNSAGLSLLVATQFHTL